MLKKEFRQLFRDPKMRAMIFGPPVMMLLVFGFAVNTDVNEVRMAVYDGDRSFLSREFIGRFAASPSFVYSASVDSPAGAVALLDRGEIDFFMHIESGFSRRIKKGESGNVQMIIDGSDSSRASVLMSYINSVYFEYSRGLLSERIKLQILRRGAAGLSPPGTAAAEPRFLFNENLVSVNFFMPGVIGLLIALITIMLTSMSIVKERESGTIEQINVSPLRPSEYILGKMLPFAIVAFADVIIASSLAIFLFRVPFNGSFLFLLFSALFFILSSLALGLYISTISATQQQAMLSSFLVFIPAILFSGFIFPVYSMPPAMQIVTWFNPLRFFVEILRSVFLKGSGLAVLWKHLLILLLMGIVLLSMSIRRYNKRAE